LYSANIVSKPLAHWGSFTQGTRVPEAMELATSWSVPWQVMQLPSDAVWAMLRLHLAIWPGWQS
jgi:hypothetical protein